MASATLQRIFNLPPGGFLRSGSGFFCRLPNGPIAFVPSIFRLPWHPKAARIVDTEDIIRLLRAEMMELIVSVVALLVGIHYFFTDILDFYTAFLSLPLAVVAHVITTFAAVLFLFAINNAGFACFRIRATAKRPRAPADFVVAALDRWSAKRPVWLLSFISGEKAATLNKAAVVLYLLMFLCSGPLLLIVCILLIVSGQAGSLSGTVSLMLAAYIAISVWAQVESTMVLRQRMQAGRRRREARQAAAQGL